MVNAHIPLMITSLSYERQWILLWSKQVTGLTLHGHATSFLIVFDRTHEELVLHQQVREEYTENNRTYPTSYKAFPRLLWAQFDKWSTSEEKSKHIRHNIVAHDHRDRYDGPDQTLKNVLNDQVTLCDDDQQCDMGPGKQAELFHIILLNQRQHKPHEANTI